MTLYDTQMDEINNTTLRHPQYYDFCAFTKETDSHDLFHMELFTVTLRFTAITSNRMLLSLQKLKTFRIHDFTNVLRKNTRRQLCTHRQKTKNIQGGRNNTETPKDDYDSDHDT